jgi:hypothetical protein
VTFAAGAYASIVGSVSSEADDVRCSRDDDRGGRRCQFCAPDLNPQIDLPRQRILEHVRTDVVTAPGVEHPPRHSDGCEARENTVEVEGDRLARS